MSPTHEGRFAFRALLKCQGSIEIISTVCACRPSVPSHVEPWCSALRTWFTEKNDFAVELPRFYDKPRGPFLYSRCLQNKRPARRVLALRIISHAMQKYAGIYLCCGES